MAGDILENTQSTPGPSNIHRISGAQPGVLDPTQPSRLLRFQGAKLSFAAFDPLTAYVQATPDLTRLNLNTESYRPRRVVIETAPSGESTWRFVPGAKREEGVADEGSWPRIVDICGQFAELTQDQWDIYKLDPLYECFVRRPSQLTVIRNVSQPHLPSPQPTGKRQLASQSPPPHRTMPPPRAPTDRYALVESESDSNDEEEVESMIIGDQQPRPRHRSATREFKECLKKKRQERREKLSRKMEIFSQADRMQTNVYFNDKTFDQHPQTPERSSVTPEAGKRKATNVLDTSWSPDARELDELRMRNATNYVVTSNTKRTRTIPSTGTQRELKQKRMERTRLKHQRRMAEAEARRWEREKRLLAEIMEEVSQPGPEDFLFDKTSQDAPASPNGGFGPQTQEKEDQEGEDLLDEEEAAHLAAIEESRRKLAELERDRPLWEEQAKQRRLREAVEQQALEAKAEKRRCEEARKRAHAEALARKEREEAEAKKREQEKNVKRERELREQERRQRQQRWSFGPWTTQRALERYRILSEAFDDTRFTSELPLTVEDVPWPSLQSPRTFSVEDVNWDSVERFFEAIRPHLRLQDYKTLVEKSHRRFHPDRWRSRNLLRTVEDEAVRGCMEVAANTVAQALTPLWRNLTGR